MHFVMLEPQWVPYFLEVCPVAFEDPVIHPGNQHWTFPLNKEQIDSILNALKEGNLTPPLIEESLRMQRYLVDSDAAWDPNVQGLMIITWPA